MTPARREAPIAQPWTMRRNEGPLHRRNTADNRMKNLYIGVARLELHIPEARSLKAKRSHTRSLAERIRNRHQVTVLETDHQNLHQRAEFAIGAFSTDVQDLEARLQRVSDTIHRHWSGYILGWEIEIIQA